MSVRWICGVGENKLAIPIWCIHIYTDPSKYALTQGSGRRRGWKHESPRNLMNNAWTQEQRVSGDGRADGTRKRKYGKKGYWDFWDWVAGWCQTTFFARVRKLAHWQALQNVFFNFISSCYLTKRGEVILKSRIEMIMRLSIPMNYYRNNGGAFGNGVRGRISEIWEPTCHVLGPKLRFVTSLVKFVTAGCLSHFASINFGPSKLFRDFPRTSAIIHETDTYCA